MTTTKSQAVVSASSHAGSYVLPLVQNEDNILVDGRLLHAKLQVKEKFSDWSKRRVEEYGFKEDFDYFRNFGSKNNGRGGHNKIDFHFTIDTAKELCMVERSEIGRSFRRYFIEAEKELRTKRLYAQTTSLTDIAKRVKPIELNGRRMFQLRPLQELLGYSTRSSTTNVRRCNAGLLVVFNRKAYVAEDYVKLMLVNATARALRAEAKMAKPVLPPNFGQLSLTL